MEDEFTGSCKTLNLVCSEKVAILQLSAGGCSCLGGGGGVGGGVLEKNS